MSLRFRLNLLITLMFLLILGAGAMLVIQHARRAVQEETRSTANLTLNLLEVALGRASPTASPLEAILAHLAKFEETRHLHIDLLRPDGSRESAYPETAITRNTQAPDWFVRLVTPPAMRFTRNVAPGSSYGMQIVIEADPADEISEAWKEARALLGLLLAFCLLTNGLIYFTLGRSLKPINSILGALENIERGDYQSRLPLTNLPELDAIAEKFNHMAEVLERSRVQTQLLAQKSLAIQEQERRYLAHELHDELGQSVSAIKALAVSIGQRSSSDPDVARSAQTIADTSQRIYDVVRGMMRRLRPVILDELGLVPALQNIIDEWNSRHGDSFCRFDSEGDLNNLSDEININVYRIVQEALTNIAKHAMATEVDIAVKRASDAMGTQTLSLVIADNGRGFDLSQARAGLGLVGMRERAGALNGRFELQTSPAQGVTLTISLPIDGDQGHARAHSAAH